MSRPEAGGASRATPNRWGLGEAVAGFVVGIIVAALAAGVADSVTGFHPGGGRAYPVGVTVADVAGLWCGLVGAAVVASRRHAGGGLGEAFGLRWGGWWDVVGGALVGILAQYVVIPLLYLPFEQLDRGLAHQLSKPAQQDTAGAHGVVAGVVLIVVLALGAPLVEELFFRGLLLRALLGRVGPPLAIVVSGLLFALAHFEAVQFAGLAVFGVILGTLAWRSGRLIPGIAAHAAFNAAAVVSLIRAH